MSESNDSFFAQARQHWSALQALDASGNPLHWLIDTLRLFAGAVWRCHHATTAEERDRTVKQWATARGQFWPTFRIPIEAFRELADPAIAWCAQRGYRDLEDIAIVKNAAFYAVELAKKTVPISYPEIYSHPEEAWEHWNQQGILLLDALQAVDHLRDLAARTGDVWKSDHRPPWEADMEDWRYAACHHDKSKLPESAAKKSNGNKEEIRTLETLRNAWRQWQQPQTVFPGIPAVNPLDRFPDWPEIQEWSCRCFRHDTFTEATFDRLIGRLQVERRTTLEEALKTSLSEVVSLLRGATCPKEPGAAATDQNKPGQPCGTDDADQNERKSPEVQTLAPGQDAGEPIKPIPTDEANILIRNYLKERERKGIKVTARAVAEECGIALGRVSSMPSWQAYQARKKTAEQPGKPKEPRQLTDKVLATIGQTDDPSAKLISKEEAAWRYLIENARTPEERARLNAMTPAEKGEAIQLAMGQLDDQNP
jgi:hypothetical protein